MKGLMLATSLLLTVVIVAAACSSDGADTPTPPTAPTGTSFPTATQAPPPTEGPRPETLGAETPEQVMPTPEAVVATPAPTVSLEDPAPTKESKEEVSITPLIWVNDAAPSVDLQIFDADVIVVASLVSATAGVQQDGESLSTRADSPFSQFRVSQRDRTCGVCRGGPNR